MNLVKGIVVETISSDYIENDLAKSIIETLAEDELDVKMVVAACGKLVKSIKFETFSEIASNLAVPEYVVAAYYQQLKSMFSAKALKKRLEKELGKGYDKAHCFKPINSDTRVYEQIKPLGVLFHVAAGNVDGLPAYSVIEGLLTGNINILKLPSNADGGLTIQLLLRLVEIEPLLKNYIYVFDYSSKEKQRMKELIELADAVVVWGSDSATASLRKMVPPNVKLIEWGHKVSFAYATIKGMSRANMIKLAQHICETDQLLCSSCQGIYLDTDEMEELENLAVKFQKILNQVAKKYPRAVDLGISSKRSLQLLNEELDAIDNGQRLLKDANSAVIVYRDSELTTSYMYRTVWMKRLPRRDFLQVIRKHKNHLQTISLLCKQKETEELRQLVLKTGIVKVVDVLNMSNSYCGEPHDGEFSLRRYTRIVNWEENTN